MIVKLLLGLLLSTDVDAWSSRPSSCRSSPRALTATSKNLEEFDYLLRETTTANQQFRHSRRIITTGNDQYSKTILASSFAAPTTEQQQLVESTTDGESTAEEEYDPYANVLDSQMNKIQQIEERSQQSGLEARLKQMDLQDIVVTLILPSIAVFAAARWTFNKVSGRVGESADSTLDSFASEMIYHDGDFEEMKMCLADYKKRLVWMGPKKTDAMLQRYLELYAKKKTVSPQAISSLSYVFNLFKLSEEKAAQVLVTLCRRMGEDKISSVGKLLFFGNHILKSDEGKNALIPIKEMIKGTYRDATVAETLVETSQQAIGEAAYRAAVQAAGANQKELTVGWEVLGLTREAATRIFEDEAKEGFVSDRVTMYGGQTQKYDKHGNPIDKEGNLVNPEDANKSSKGDDEEEVTSNVYECSDCGYTLFVAKGREFKFYGDDFKCPNCGAKKDKFKPRTDMDE